MCIFMKPNLKNEQGFTILETLISLFVSSFVIMLLTGGLLNVMSIRDTMVNNAQNSSRTNQISGDRQVEWHIFLNQLESYLQGSYDPEVLSNHIKVKVPKTTISKGYQDIFYRIDGSTYNFSRRDSNGYHRMLTEIQKIDFTQEDGWLEAEVTFSNGQTFRGRIWVESWVEIIDEVEEEEEEEEEKESETGLEEEEQEQEDENKNEKDNE